MRAGEGAEGDALDEGRARPSTWTTSGGGPLHPSDGLLGVGITKPPRNTSKHPLPADASSSGPRSAARSSSSRSITPTCAAVPRSRSTQRNSLFHPQAERAPARGVRQERPACYHLPQLRHAAGTHPQGLEASEGVYHVFGCFAASRAPRRTSSRSPLTTRGSRSCSAKMGREIYQVEDSRRASEARAGHLRRPVLDRQVSRAEERGQDPRPPFIDVHGVRGRPSPATLASGEGRQRARAAAPGDHHGGRESASAKPSSRAPRSSQSSSRSAATTPRPRPPRRRNATRRTSRRTVAVHEAGAVRLKAAQGAAQRRAMAKRSAQCRRRRRRRRAEDPRRGVVGRGVERERRRDRAGDGRFHRSGRGRRRRGRDYEDDEDDADEDEDDDDDDEDNEDEDESDDEHKNEDKAEEKNQAGDG